MISVNIATRNEEDLIGDALDKLSFADEIVVFDMASTDKTREVAKKHGSVVVLIPIPSVVEECRARQVREAKGDWVLLLDADERVTPELAQEIQEVVKESKDIGAYAIPRENYSFGRLLKHGGWNESRDLQIRLINKKRFIDWPRQIHSTPKVKGEVRELAHPLIHLKDNSIEDMVDRTNRYSRIEAEMFYQGGIRVRSPFTLIRKFVMEVLRRGVFKQGFRDGIPGVIEFIYQGFSVFVTYAKIYERQLIQDQQPASPSQGGSTINHQAKRVLLVSPYFNSVGGGEKYMLTIGEILANQGSQVTIGWDSRGDIDNALDKLGIKLSSYELDPEWRVLRTSGNPLSTWIASRRYDVVVYLSDGSIPLLGAKKNVIHFQVPFHDVGGGSWKNRLKLRSIHEVIVNSRFTKSFIDREYGLDSTVVYPPITSYQPPAKKENIILSVGRFEHSINIKKQNVLIEAFKQAAGFNQSFTLVLAGSVVPGSEAFVEQLRESAKGYNIKIIANPTHEEISDLYRAALVYWHAAGYGVDEAREPENVEHFGMSTVEAISAGAIPLVVPKGGQKEIIADSGYFWNSIPELTEKTKRVIDKKHSALLDANVFSKQYFVKAISGLLQ